MTTLEWRDTGGAGELRRALRVVRRLRPRHHGPAGRLPHRLELLAGLGHGGGHTALKSLKLPVIASILNWVIIGASTSSVDGARYTASPG